MKRLFVLVGVLVGVVAAASVQAQTPTVGVYFDKDYWNRMDKDCPPGGGVDTAYVVAKDFNAYVAGIEYQILYPGTMTWLADLDVPPVHLGTTPEGIMEAWALPLNGYFPMVVAKILFMWNCDGCTVTDDPIVVAPYPYSGYVRAVDFPQYNFIEGIGMTSLVCATVPTEDATWGRIKALYDE